MDTQIRCVKAIYTQAEGRKRVSFTDGTTTSYARIMATLLLRRPLLKEEVVHHRNRDPGDDSLENLEVFPTWRAHGAHHGREHTPRHKSLPYATTLFNFRAPGDLKARLKEEAARNGRSLNSEIVQRLQRSLDSYRR